MGEKNNQREWDREEVVILVVEYFRTKNLSPDKIKENQQKVSEFLKSREEIITGKTVPDIFRNYAGIHMQSGRIQCLDPETPYFGMKGTKLQKQIVQEYLENPSKITNEAEQIYKKYNGDKARKPRIKSLSHDLDEKTEAFCRKYELLLRALYEDEELREWCHKQSAYSGTNEHLGLRKIIYDDLFEQAYDDGIVINNYAEILEDAGIELDNLTMEKAKSFSKEQIIAAIAYYYRRDHFIEGSFINNSIADGIFLILIQAYIEICDEEVKLPF